MCMSLCVFQKERVGEGDREGDRKGEGRGGGKGLFGWEQAVAGHRARPPGQEHGLLRMDDDVLGS